MKNNELMALVLIVLIVTVGTYFIVDNIFQPKQIGVISPLVTTVPVPTVITSSPINTPTPTLTVVPTVTRTQTITPKVTKSQDPIIGQWSIEFANGGSAQMVVSADGSIKHYIEHNSGQIMATGTWQSIGDGKYTGTTVPVIVSGGTVSSDNWILSADSNKIYDPAYPALVYSRVGGG